MKRPNPYKDFKKVLDTSFKKLTKGKTEKEIENLREMYSPREGEEIPLYHDPYLEASPECIREKSKLDDMFMLLLQLPEKEPLEAYKAHIDSFNARVTENALDWFFYPDKEFKIKLAEEALEALTHGKNGGRGMGEANENLKKLVKHWAEEHKAKNHSHSQTVSIIKNKLDGKKLKEDYGNQFSPLPNGCKRGRDWISENIKDIIPPRPRKQKQSD